ncbi:SPFH domain-containing protein [Streptomyces sp. NPDC090025]|uniref:SPFH domain-containing protein n=1 Tax=Streptomyces sp. NPDC090025 TaxID=3365922 RepID=UPI0038387FA0
MDTQRLKQPWPRIDTKTSTIRPATAPHDTLRVPRADPELRERPAAALPGWCAVAVAAGLLTAAFLLAAIGRVPYCAELLPPQLLGDLAHPPARGTLPEQPAVWLAAVCVLSAAFCLAGLVRVPTGTAVVLHNGGSYHGTLRRTGLWWASPLRRRRTVDVRFRHWRSRIEAVADRDGTPLDVVLLVVWHMGNTTRALYAVNDHEAYVKERVEAVTARLVSSLPCDPVREGEPSLRDGGRLAGELTRTLHAELRPAGIDVYSVQIARLDYAASVAEPMLRRRLAALEARHRESTLDEVVEAVDATVRRLTAEDGATWSARERQTFVRELTVAFYSARTYAVASPEARS